MKKLSPKLEVLLKRRQYSSLRRLLLSSGKRRRQAVRAKSKKSLLIKPVGISAPDIFEISSQSQRIKLISFVSRIAEYLSRNRRVRLNFDETKTLKPCGTLYFIAAIEDFLHLFPGKISAKYPIDDVVEQLFQHVGILECFGLSKRKVVTADNVVNWHFAKGSDATTDAFKSLLKAHEKALGGEIIRSELYACLSEAVTNTRTHAYPNRADGVNNWWMFSQAMDNKLTVAICDLGIGITKSLLSKPELSDYLRRAYRILSKRQIHKDLIKVAVSSDRTQTGLAYRGKGLPQMLDLIKGGSEGGFRVQSSYGLYQYDAATKSDQLMTLEEKIRGTLIQWTLPLNVLEG